MTDADADSHREKNPKRQKAVEERELFPSSRGADLTSCNGSSRHQHDSQHGTEIVAGTGAPSSAYFAGVQQAFVRRAMSACIAFSSLSEARVWRRICVAPLCDRMT